MILSATGHSVVSLQNTDGSSWHGRPAGALTDNTGEPPVPHPEGVVANSLDIDGRVYEDDGGDSMVSEVLKVEPLMMLAATESRAIAGSFTLVVWAVLAIFAFAATVFFTFVMELISGSVGFLVCWTPMILLMLDGVFRGATFGMRRNKLSFASLNGEKISHIRCSLRIVMGFLLIPLLPVSAIVMGSDRFRRSLADLICGTAVWEPTTGLENESKIYGFEVIPLEKRQS